MDLERMRRDDFTRTIFGWIEHFGLNDQDAMLAYVGPERAVLEHRWNALPVLEDVHDPALVHWASLGKPWDSHLTFGQELWTPPRRRCCKARAANAPRDGHPRAARAWPASSRSGRPRLRCGPSASGSSAAW